MRILVEQDGAIVTNIQNAYLTSVTGHVVKKADKCVIWSNLNMTLNDTEKVVERVKKKKRKKKIYLFLHFLLNFLFWHDHNYCQNRLYKFYSEG